MNLETFEVGSFLKREKPRHDTKYTSHPLKEFFFSRGVSMPKLAKLLSVNSMTVYTWFRGQKPMPVARELQLEQIKAKILDWEGRNGKRFPK
jgi:hypothetical protein